MDELITWLRAQLDEDERVARTLDAERDVARHVLGTELAALLEQVPDEVQVKRRILAQYDDVRHEVRNPTSGEHFANARARQFQLEQTLQLLARPYAGRQGWREEWRDAPRA